MSDQDKPNFESARPTLVLNSDTSPSNDPMQAAEVRMRRAWGLDGDQPRPRPVPERSEPAPRPAERFTPPGHKRRFVHDGEVPVTLVHGLTPGRREHDTNGRGNGAHAQPTNRLEVAEAALASEIATRERAERAAQELQASVHDLRTKLGHAELARQEAVAALQREREAAASLRASLHELEAQLAAARSAHQAAEQALATLRAGEAVAVDAATQYVPRRRGRPPRSVTVAPPEPAPVPPRKRGRPPRIKTAAAVEPAAVAPRKRGRPRSTEAKPAHEPKPIRWWITPQKNKKKR